MANRRVSLIPGASLAFGSLAASYTAVGAAVEGRGVIIAIANSLNVDCWLSLDGGTTDFIQLPAATSITLDLGANDAEFSGTIAVKQGTAGAAASGLISRGVIRVI